MALLTRNFVKSAIAPTLWDFSNKLLYDLCSQHPNHTDQDKIIAKILFIGRVYAAAIERRKNKSDSEPNDDFYVNVVAPQIHKSPIDHWLQQAQSVIPGTNTGFSTLVTVHKNVMDLFSRISGLDKRSLASKYLHFHVPKLFYIFDSRAVAGMRIFSPELPRASRSDNNGDNEYRKFVEKCSHLSNYCEKQFGLHLLPRQVDMLLLAAHAGRKSNDLINSDGFTVR